MYKTNKEIHYSKNNVNGQLFIMKIYSVILCFEIQESFD